LEEPFSSVDFPLVKVGGKAVEILLSGDLSKRTVTIKPELVKYV
jgi:DNA-binding protein YbaB